MRLPRPAIPVESLVDGVLQFLGVIKNAPVDSTDSLVFGRTAFMDTPISLPNQTPLFPAVLSTTPTQLSYSLEAVLSVRNGETRSDDGSTRQDESVHDIKSALGRLSCARGI